MLTRTFVQALLVVVTLITGCAMKLTTPDNAALQSEVTITERAFAQTMQDRDHAAFVGFLADDAIFFTGPHALHGKRAVAAAWQRFYTRRDAPFSWEPTEVEVLASGTLAISSGPVRNAEGKLIATFISVWRQEAPGVWRIVFDKGNDACECNAAR